MLAGELAAYKQRATVPVSMPAPNAGDEEVGQTAGDPTQGPLRGQICHSLPVGNHFSSMAHGMPAKPRVRPSPAPSLLSNLPMFSLPESSPCVSPPTFEGGRRSGSDSSEEKTAAGPDQEESGGTSLMVSLSCPPPIAHVMAASAPASMLWGPQGHAPGAPALGGRQPSRTLLQAMEEAKLGPS
jgi:hypothetical protein